MLLRSINLIKNNSIIIILIFNKIVSGLIDRILYLSILIALSRKTFKFFQRLLRICPQFIYIFIIIFLIHVFILKLIPQCRSIRIPLCWRIIISIIIIKLRRFLKPNVSLLRNFRNTY